MLMDWQNRNCPPAEDFYYIAYPIESSRTPAVEALDADRKNHENDVYAHLELHKKL